MQQFKYGKQEDIERLRHCANVGGCYSCKLNKMPNGKLDGTLANSQICDIDHPIASSITAHYYKGLSAHKDNMVIEIWKIK